MRDIDNILIKPILTEKTNIEKEQNKYVFKVDKRVNKLQVLEAVKKLFEVHPVKCNIINIAKKPKRERNRSGFTASWKKAIITLPKGETISIFEGA